MTNRHRVLWAMATASVLGAFARDAAADAEIRVGMAGQPTGAKNDLSDADPVAVSGALLSDPANILGGTQYAAAAADLSAGTLRIGTLSSGGGDPEASAVLYDKLTASGPGKTAKVAIHVVAGGSLHGSGGTGASFVQGISATISFGSVNKGGSVTHYFAQGAMPEDSYDVPPPGQDPDTIVTQNGSSVTIDSTATADVPIGAPIDVRITLNTLGGRGCASCDHSDDFGHTAHVTMTVPAGYTVTSQSGVFLAQAGANGLDLPPDGGVGAHGSPGFSGGGGGGIGDGGGGGASPSGNGAGSPTATPTTDGGANAASNGSSDSGGCSATSGTAETGGFAAFVAGLLFVAGRRRRAKRS